MKKPDKDTEESIDEAVEEIDQEAASADVDAPTDDGLSEELELPTKRRERSGRRRKISTFLVLVGLLAGVTAAVPFLRYALVGAFYSRPVTLRIVDASTQKPVSGATVTIGRESAKSDGSGNARFEKISVGDHYMTIEKKYYETAKGSVLIPIFADVPEATRKLKATGRTVAVTVTNALTKQPLSGAIITLSDSSAITDPAGVAQVVVGIDAGSLSGTVSLDGFNPATYAVDTAKNDDQTVKIDLVPTGAIYYLSKSTGVINLMRANLDGSNPSVIVAATGRESDRDTPMVATADWRYIVLLANRDGAPRLYLVDTKDNSLTLIDNESAAYTPIGWLDHTLVFVANRDVASWQPGRSAIKVFDADARKLNLVDESQANGTNSYDYQMQMFTTPIINNGVIEYGKSWTAVYPSLIADKKTQIVAADSNGTKRVLREFDAANSVDYLSSNTLDSAYASVYNMNDQNNVVYQITGGKVTNASIDQATLTGMVLPTRLRSESGEKSAWSEARDGKYYVFVGDGAGRNGKQQPPVGYKLYGWIGDRYLLLTKNDSELFIYTLDATGVEPLKIIDYHKPTYDYTGWGYGASA